ncbi:MAG: TonB-dependent receptor, partial [Rhodothermales bacterium]|nr:TonB-dependent receptor [Rhodothermales bacterium]
MTSSDGGPLEGAAVTLRRAGDSLLRYGTVTRSDGSFELSGVAEGTWHLRVSYVGFAPHERTILLVADTRLELDISLDASTLTQPEVIVSSRRVRKGIAPVTLTNIDRAEIERQPDMKDLPVLLARTPSITQHSENGNAIGYSTLRMRGFGQRRLAVAINGIPQNDPEDFNVFWINFFDIQGATQDIQIQRGAGSSVYGPTAIGGAINIRAMPYRPDFYAKVHLGGGSFGTRRYSAELNSGLLADRYVVFGRLSRLESDGYRDWSWTEFTRFFAGATRYGERSTLTLQAYGGPQRDGLAFSGIPKAANTSAVDDGFGGTIDRTYNFSAFTRDTEDFHQPHAELHHEWAATDDVRLSQTLFWVKGEGYFDFGGTFRSADYLRLPAGTVPDGQRGAPLFISLPDATVLFRAVLDQWQVGWLPSVSFTSDVATTTAGIEGRLHRSLRWGRIEEGTGLPSEVVGPENDVRVYSFRGEKAIAAGYVSHLRRLHERWAVQGDMQVTWRRYRVYDEDNFGTSFSKPYVFVNPRVGMTYNPEHPFSAFASVALASREPRLKSLYDGEEAGAGFTPRFRTRPDGSFDTDAPLVDVEHLLDIEVGTRLRRSMYEIGLNGFVMAFRDEIVPSGGLDQFGVPRTGNADRSRHIGLEVDASARVARGLDVRGNATISSNRFVRFSEFALGPGGDIVEIDRGGNAIAGFPGAMGNLSIQYTRSSVSAALFAGYVGRQYVDNSEGRTPDGTSSDGLVIDAHTLVDATLRYRFPASGP